MVAAAAFVLSLSALALGGNASGAHAATPPTITATSPADLQITVTGSGFSIGDSVVVEVYNSNYQLTNYYYTTATESCLWWHGLVCGGTINMTRNVSACASVHVIAYDYGLATWSNWSDVYVGCL
jgi:ABC-type phosphate transport system substrate-binding protein